MELGQRELLFFVSTLGWFNGLILSVYFLFFTKKRSLAHRLFGLVLLALSVRIAKSVIWYFQPGLSIWWVQFGLAVCLQIGPLLYCYLQASLTQATRMRRSWWVLLGAWLAVGLGLLVFFTRPEQLILWKRYFAFAIYTQWLLTVVGCFWLIRPLAFTFWRNRSALQPHEKWLLAVYGNNLFIVLTYTLTFYKVLNLAYISGALAFSSLLYANVLLLLYRRRTDDLFHPPVVKVAPKKLETETARALGERLLQVLAEKSAYQNPDLSLPLLAQMLGISAHQLSQLLNEHFQKPFPTFLHEYRIARACALMAAEPDLKIEAIGYEVGYQAKSTFLAAFKKVKGVTPTQYKENLATA